MMMEFRLYVVNSSFGRNCLAQQEEEYKIRGTKSGSIDYSSALLLQGYNAYNDRINYHDLRLLPDLRKAHLRYDR